MTAPELKPCPFCGGNASISKDHDPDGSGAFYAVKCHKCRAKSSEIYAVETCHIHFAQVRDAWNRRADLAAVTAQVRVKPLVWGWNEGLQGWRADCELTRDVFCAYDTNAGWAASSQTTGSTIHANADAAKYALDGNRAARILAAIEPLPDPRELTVWYGKMPESNGRENWTAILRPKAGDNLNGILDGFCFARSEYPDRVRYEADRMRWIIGELTEKPDILAYDADLHSGYVERPDPRDAVIARLVEAVEAAFENGMIPKSTALNGGAPSYSGQVRVADKIRAALAAAKAVQHG